MIRDDATVVASELVANAVLHAGTRLSGGAALPGARADHRSRAVAHAVLAESGVDGLAEMVDELTLNLAEAIQRVAADDGVPRADLEVWFVE